MNKVFVVTHLPFERTLTEPYSSIRVGGKVFPSDFSDDCEDEIAQKNPYFCELTALYWVWKNYKYQAKDYMGLVHYRRSLTSGNIFDVLFCQSLTDQRIKKDLETFDLILPKPDFFEEGLYQQYVKSHPANDLDLCFDVLVECYPKLKENIDRYKDMQHVSLFNIFISKATLFNEYCNWLFPVLFQLETMICLDGRSAYQNRVFGFLAERLLNIWVMSKPSLKIKYYPLLRVDKSGLSNLRRLFFS